MNTAAKVSSSATRLAAVVRRHSLLTWFVVLAAAVPLAQPQQTLGQGFDFGSSEQDAAAQKARVERIAKQIQELRDQSEKLQSMQVDLRAKVRNQSGLSPENVKPMLLTLERERFTLEIDLKLKLARRAQLAKLIAEETTKAGNQIDRDEVTEHLKKIVAARRQLFAVQTERLKVGATNAGEAQIGAAEAELAEAEVRLAMRKQELAKSRAGAGIEQLNQQLQGVSLEAAQDTLRLELLKERLDTLGGVENVLDAYKATSEVELPRVLRLLEQTQTQKGRLEIGGGSDEGGSGGGGPGCGN